MKNARTVCACKNVGELRFEGIGGVVIGKYRSNFDKRVLTRRVYLQYVSIDIYIIIYISIYLIKNFMVEKIIKIIVLNILVNSLLNFP